jgi:hypothetical protein
MSFEDLERLINQYFRRQTAYLSADYAVKQTTKRLVLKAFEDSYRVKTPWWSFVRQPAKVGLALCFVLIGAFINKLFPESYAGSLQSTAGIVEVIRDDQVLIVSNKKSFRLKVGDVINVDQRSQAFFNTKGLKTQLKGGTQVRVADAKNLFVQEGSIEASLSNGNTVSTHRGFISTPDQGTFRMEILPTGEAHVVLENDKVEVNDWLQNNALLSVVGDELRLKTDTQLSDIKVPKDLKLSDSQLQVIASKLIIARSKIFTGLEKSLTRRNSGKKDIESAENTFRSIMQVVRNTDRQLNVYGNVDLNSIKNKDVLTTIEHRTNDQVLLLEARSFLALLKIIEHKEVEVNLSPSDEKTFNRYVLTTQLQALANQDQAQLLEHVKKQYVSTALRKIINEEKRSAQVEELKKLVMVIPDEQPQKKYFLSALNDQLDPILQEFLTEFVKRTR